MATLPNAYAELDALFNLEEHRNFIRRASRILSGIEAQSVLDYTDYKVVNVYRVPTAGELVRQPELTQTDYGHLTYDSEGAVNVALSSGEQAFINQTAHTPHKALQYISQLMQQTTTRKIDLKLKSNEFAERKRRRAAVPEAVQDILTIYDDLIKQIEHEHYHQLRLAKEQQQTGRN